MYNSQAIAEMIKQTAKEKNVSLSSLFSEIGVTNNTLHNMNKSMPKVDTLAKIADYLDCSVDYLLGRTDERSVNSGNAINTGDINGNNNANMSIGNVNNGSEQFDEMTNELIKLFKELTFTDKMDIMNKIIEKSKK